HHYAHPPDLPSFPTRRSSDLDPLGALRNPAIGDDSIPRPGRKAPCAALVPVVDQVSVMAHRDLQRRAGAGRRLFEAYGQPRLDLDRKSTRLNSSHLVISYAVF